MHMVQPFLGNPKQAIASMVRLGKGPESRLRYPDLNSASVVSRLGNEPALVGLLKSLAGQSIPLRCCETFCRPDQSVLPADAGSAE